MYFPESRFILSTKCCDDDSQQNLFWEFMTSNYQRTLNTIFFSTESTNQMQQLLKFIT